MMGRLTRRLAALFILPAITVVACQPAPSGTAITNVTVIDAVNGVRANHTVIFDGDEIIGDLPHRVREPGRRFAAGVEQRFVVTREEDLTTIISTECM